MGTPNNFEEFDAFQVDDVIIYIAKDVLAKELNNNTLNIYIEGYGRYLFVIK